MQPIQHSPSRMKLLTLLLIACIGGAASTVHAANKSSKRYAEKSASPMPYQPLSLSSQLLSLTDVEECEDEDTGQIIQSRLLTNTWSLPSMQMSNKLASPDVSIGRGAPLPAGVASTASQSGSSADSRTSYGASPPQMAKIEVIAPAPTKALAVSPSLATTPSATWEIALTDKTLNAALARWTAIAGWQLLWELPVDYAVEARTTVPGSFEEAVSTVAKSMETAEIPMKAIFYKGNRVLRIVPTGAK